MTDTPEELTAFVKELAPVVVQGYLGSTPYPNESGEHYISFGQSGIKYQNVEMPLQDVLSTDTFKETLTDYAQGLQRLIIRDWPSIRQDKFGKWIIRARLVGDDGVRELRNE